MTRIAAVILAGGRGERLGGVNKALLDIGGKRLIDRALGAVRGCEPIILSTGKSAFEADGSIAVGDLPSGYGGPLAGVAAAIDRLSKCPPELLFSMAVDTPFFPSDFIRRAMPALDGADVVLASYGGQDYPTNALWRFDRLAELPALLRSGTAPHSLKRLAAGLRVARLDYATLVSEDPFMNANTPEDLAILQARADALRPG